MPIPLVNVYLLNVPSVSSPYFNKIKRTSYLGKWHALSLEILCDTFPSFRQKKGTIFRENRLPADDSHGISYLICYF